MKYCIDALSLTRLLTLLATFALILAASPPVPADKSQVNKWFSDNVKPLADRKAELDPALVAAEEGATVVKVRADGSGDFKTVTEAINSVPTGNTKRVVIWIGGGVYKEKLKIERTKPFVTLYGSPNNMPNLTFDGDANKFGTVYSATLTVESDYFTAANLIIVNSSPRPDGKRKGAQALAARLMGTKAAVYNCKFIGFQDTLCDDDGLHLYKDCFIQGTVDFIFGKGTSLYLNSQLDVVGDGGLAVITAHSREEESDPSGYSFVHGSITGTGGKNTYLGRAWMARSRTVFAYTTMADIINPEGWNDMKHPGFDSTVLFGEYKCSGPGSEPSGRVKYSKQLSDVEVKPFVSLGFLQSDKWLLPPPNPEKFKELEPVNPRKPKAARSTALSLLQNQSPQTGKCSAGRIVGIGFFLLAESSSPPDADYPSFWLKSLIGKLDYTFCERCSVIIFDSKSCGSWISWSVSESRVDAVSFRELNRFGQEMDSEERTLVEILEENIPIDMAKYIKFVSVPQAGAISTFSGTTRDNFEGKTVVELRYEAYVPMAIRSIKSICSSARSSWNLHSMAVAHRLGPVPVGEISVFIAVSAIHRADAMDSCRFVIDELKASVPIWKKEVYDNGEVWKENSEFMDRRLELGKKGADQNQNEAESLRHSRKSCCGSKIKVNEEHDEGNLQHNIG